jgi:linoleate 10R-lipoxygenase
VIRSYSRWSVCPEIVYKGSELTKIQKEAQKDERIFPDATKVILDEKKRGLNKYLVYGASLDVFDVKQLTLIGLTGMLKYLAKLKDLRVAHDKLGRLKRAKTPTGVQCYLTIQWDQLVSFPTSKFFLTIVFKEE